MRKAQITMFILVGIILLFTVLLFIWLFNFRAEHDGGGLVIDPRPRGHQTATQTFFEQCLEQQAIEGLQLLGAQGGAIFVDQNGTLSDTGVMRFDLNGDLQRVKYGVVNSNPLPAPEYPLGGPSTSLASLLISAQQNPSARFFGKVDIFKLCSNVGPNRQDNPRGFITCPGYAYGFGETTFQDQLHDYIRATLPSCLEPELNRSDITPTNNFTVQVVYGNDDISLSLFYPVNSLSNFLSDQGSANVLLDARLKRVYQLMYRMLDREVADPRFDKTQDYINLADCRFDRTTDRCWDDQIDVEVLRDVVNQNDILRLVDYGSSLYGQPLVFQVALQNRRPMLDFVVDLDNGTIPENVTVVGVANSTLLITPRGYDADEDRLRVVYSAWGQDYITFYNSTLCANNSDANASCWSTRFGGFVPFMNSSLFVDGGDCLSQNRSSVCASLFLENSHRGVHKTVVRVFDDAGLDDYQNVTLFVRGIPVVVNGSNVSNATDQSIN